DRGRNAPARCQFVFLERLQPFQSMLMKDNRQPQPDKNADEDDYGGELKGRVIGGESKDQKQQADGGLQRQPKEGYFGRTLVGVMVYSHSLLKARTPDPCPPHAPKKCDGGGVP